jgi:hypothetical protein
MLLKKHLFLLLFLFVISNGVKAQEVEETETLADTSAPGHDPIDPNKIPRRRALMSAVVPGLGQIYNHKYWKLPIIYGGIATCVYLAIQNDQQYHSFRQAYSTAQISPENYPKQETHTPDGLRVDRDFHRRNRDLFIIVTGVIYALNIVDAYVDAHLRTFDLSDDLSLEFKPEIFNNYSYFCPGISVLLTFNK